MVEKTLNRSKLDQLDPFPVDLSINLFSLVTSIISVVLSCIQLRDLNKRTKIEKEILEATLELHNKVEDFILVLGRVAPELEEKKMRFHKTNIFMPWRDLRRYDGIEEKLSEILNKVRDLSSEMRKAVLNNEIKEGEEIYYEEIAYPMDNLISKISSMTFSDFCASLVDVLEHIENWLTHKNQ